MPRNICRSPSRVPRTRPALVLTTGDAAAERANGVAASIPSDAAPNNRRRRRSTVSGRGIVQCPVLNQCRPDSDILACNATQAKAMTACIEQMQLTAHGGPAQRVVHEQRIFHRYAGIV